MRYEVTYRFTTEGDPLWVTGAMHEGVNGMEGVNLQRINLNKIEEVDEVIQYKKIQEK